MLQLGAKGASAELLECVEIGGRVPRGFCVAHADPDAATGGLLVVGVQEDSVLRSFAIDAETGRLSRAGELAMPSPGVVQLAE